MLLDFRRICLLTVIFISLCVIFSCATPSIRVTKEQNQGDNLFNNHKYPEAIQHYTLMLDASKKLGIYRNPAMESEVYRKIANCYEMTGKYELALTHVRNALAIDSLNKNLINTIADYRQEGKILIYMGSGQKGILSLEKSLALSEGMDQSLKNVNRLSIADTYLALGQLYSAMGRSEKSGDLINRALVIFRQANDPRGEMEAELALGNLFSDRGDIIEARKIIERSLKKAAALRSGTSRHNRLLAAISAEAGEYENALRYQEKALKEARDYGIIGQVIWNTIGMGDIYGKIGDFTRAERYYREAQREKDTLAMNTKSLDASLNLRLGEVLSANEYYSSQGSYTGEAISSLRIAEVLLQEGKQDSAMIFLSQSEQKFAASGNREGVSNVLLYKGRILVDKGNTAAAGPLLVSALEAADFPETVWQAWFHLGRMHEILNQDEKAIESYMNSISVIEKIRGNLTIDEFRSRYFDNKREVYDRLIRILMRSGRSADAFRISEQARARAFYDILANKKIDYKGAMPGDLISLEQEKRMEIQKLYKLLQKGDVSYSSAESSRNSETIHLRSVLKETQSEYEDIIRRIKLYNPAYAEMVSAQPVKITDLQAGLDRSTAVLSYWISENELFAWLITGSGITSKGIQVRPDELAALIEKARRAIQSTAPAEEVKAPLVMLYSFLISPLEDELKGISDLVIIPNGSIHFLPFQALVTPGGDYFVSLFNIIYEPSASVFMVCSNRRVRPGSKFMGVALSDVTIEGRQGLPGTTDEVKNILPLFPENVSAFGERCTETFVKSNARGYNFIHFATHGSYDYEQPLYSHLLFSPNEEDDGRFNVFEVFELNIDASLVTLSACETGLGNLSRGDELVGLSRAFLFAGSSSVIVSLWAVADYPTSLLMANFYKYLKEHNVQEALTLAQRDVLMSFPQPVYWSPFVLIGNGKVMAK
ncbi:MAG: CHAT domain-containing protein [Bacteroidales bacterium]|nr:CHAT domain-containing protein [Bacteroidales bacterium]